jgi:hypothetical protein
VHQDERRASIALLVLVTGQSKADVDTAAGRKHPRSRSYPALTTAPGESR